jgi:hypothetical protein
MPISKPPNSQETTTTIFEAAREINDLKRRQRPGQITVVAGSVKDRNYSIAVTAIVQRKEQLSLHPDRFNRAGREDNREPITLPQSRTDFIVPLLCPKDVCATVPYGNPVTTQDLRWIFDENYIKTRVGEEHFIRERSHCDD